MSRLDPEVEAFDTTEDVYTPLPDHSLQTCASKSDATIFPLQYATALCAPSNFHCISPPLIYC